MFLKAYSRLCDPELICLKRDIAVCKGQTVECMAVRHFLENGAAKVEVWMGSGQSDSLNAQVTIVDLSEKGVEVQSNEIGCCNLVACEYSPLSSFLAVMDVSSSFLPRGARRDGCIRKQVI